MGLSEIKDNIIKITDDHFNKSLCLHYRTNEMKPSLISTIIRHLKTTNWKNFSFNQYSVSKPKKDEDGDYVIITFNYIPPSIKF